MRARDPESVRATAVALAKRTREEQGLPPTVEDAATLRAVAAIVATAPPLPAAALPLLADFPHDRSRPHPCR
jgi:hypothetical protein